jgi:septum formation protein
MRNQIRNLILASASKTRSDILSNAGVDFTVQVSNTDESIIKQKLKSKKPEEIAIKLATEKARKISKSDKEALVIGADQILECDGILFNKPLNKDDVISHLEFLSGKTHRLISAICVVQNNKKIWDLTDDVNLTMRSLSDNFIQSYVEKAGTGIHSSVGGYRLEDFGAQLFTRVEGDFFTVLGLPLLPLLDFLRSKQIIKT